ncbi:MAG: class I SAM-dependent methyltransferase [Chloroflexi bacterium]|nr:MAG: class I SAM-dependent methyltransferase [Chloroflexota bacterium]
MERLISNHSDLRRIWDHTHQTKLASELPEEDLIAFIEQLQPRLHPGMPLLDVGCGRGRNLPYLSRLGFDVYGCDISSVALKLAQARTQQTGLSLRFQAAELTHLPFASDSFAIVVCVHVLPYYFKANIIEGVRELWRVLQPKGWLYLDLLDCEDAEYGCGKRLEEHTFLDPDGVPIHFSSRQEINELSNYLTLQQASRVESKPAFGHSRVKWVLWAAKEE